METAASKKREARARRASHRQARRRVEGSGDRIGYNGGTKGAQGRRKWKHGQADSRRSGGKLKST